MGLFTIDPAWQAGKNTLSIEATGKDGKKVVNDYSFVYLPDGTVGVGETMAFSIGTGRAARAAPFTPSCWKETHWHRSVNGEASYCVIDPEGWVFSESARVVTLKAERPGETRVKIFVKRHFLLDKDLEQ